MYQVSITYQVNNSNFVLPYRSYAFRANLIIKHQDHSQQQGCLMAMERVPIPNYFN